MSGCGDNRGTRFKNYEVETGEATKGDGSRRSVDYVVIVWEA